MEDLWKYIAIFGSIITILMGVVAILAYFSRLKNSLTAPLAQIAKDIGIIKRSISDPEHGEDSFIARSELAKSVNRQSEKMAEAIRLLETKGCVATCPALPVLNKTVQDGLNEIRDEHIAFVQQSQRNREETLDALKGLFGRLSATMESQERIIGRLMDFLTKQKPPDERR